MICPICHGTGVIVVIVADSFWSRDAREESCSCCNGLVTKNEPVSADKARLAMSMAISAFKGVKHA